MEEILKIQRDLKNIINTAQSDGEKYATKNVAINMLKLGLNVKLISGATGLSEDEINGHP